MEDIKEKSADELFKQLGYYLDTAEEGSGLYCRDILDKNTFGYKDSEMIYFDNEDNGIYFTNKEYLSLEELNAINKKIEELRLVESWCRYEL